MLCRHILSVLVHKDCFEITSTYWSPRWCRQEVEHDKISISRQEESSAVATSLDNVAPLSVDLVQRPPKSTTKGRPKKYRFKPEKELTEQGRPKKYRFKPEKELTKQVKRCQLCKGVGHNISTCPDKEKFDGHVIVRKRATKRKKSIESEDLNPIFCLKC